jgi:outer membrane protein OmpA-like peptidoglycan-associated protein
MSSNYKISVSKKLCGASLLDRTTKGLTQSETLRGDTEMLCKGDIIKVENIYYDLNKWAIRQDAATELNKLVDIMNQYPDMRIELRSHTDSRSSAAFNMKLSTKRAESVLDYMAEQGVVPSRMRAAGFGESKPLNRCVDGVKCKEEEFQVNRRTEFRILSINDEERSVQDAAWAQQIAENQILRAALMDTVKKQESVSEVAFKRPGKAHKKVAAVKPVQEKPAYTMESYAVKEEGAAEAFENIKNSKKYLALHKTAPSGTMIKVRNETNNREIFVRVVGKLLSSDETNDDIIVKLSKSAIEKLEASDRRFKVEVTYFK